MPLFKTLSRSSNINFNKHSKLKESWGEIDGATFLVKYLGSSLIDQHVTTGRGTKRVVEMAKAGRRRPRRVALNVSSTGISLMDPKTQEISLQISIYDIAHCGTDAEFPNVFSFIATNKNDANECYSFLSTKRKMAQEATLTIAHSFNIAFELWQKAMKTKDSPLRNIKVPPQWEAFDDSEEVKEVLGNLGSLQLRSFGSHRMNSIGEDEEETLLINLT